MAGGGARVGVVFSGFSIGGPLNNLLPFGGWAFPLPVSRAATISKAKVDVESNSLSETAIFTVEKDGVSTGVIITVPAGATGVFSAPESEDFAEDDGFGVRLVSASAGGSIQGIFTGLLE